MERIFVGIDVAKNRLDMHVRPSGEAFAVARHGKGLETLTARLGGLGVALVVLKATGGFEVTVAGALSAAGLPLAVVNPRQIRDFARATGRLAKIDALDDHRMSISASALSGSEHLIVMSHQVREEDQALRMETNRTGFNTCCEPARQWVSAAVDDPDRKFAAASCAPIVL